MGFLGATLGRFLLVAAILSNTAAVFAKTGFHIPKLESSDPFAVSIVKHRALVILMMEGIRYQNPDDFPHVTINTGALVGVAHDIEKGLPGIFLGLKKIEGQDLSLLTPSSPVKIEGDATLDVLHRFEALVKMNLIRQQNWLNPDGSLSDVAKEHLSLDHIADLVVTEATRAGEFDRKKMLPASEFLKSAHERILALRIEPIVPEILSQFSRKGTAAISDTYRIIDRHSGQSRRKTGVDIERSTHTFEKCLLSVMKTARPILAY